MVENRYVALGVEENLGAVAEATRYQESVETIATDLGWIIPEPISKRAYQKRQAGPYRELGDIGEFDVDPNGIIGDLLYGVLGKVTPHPQDPPNEEAIMHSFVPWDTLPSYTVRIGTEQNERILEGMMVNSLKLRFATGENLKATAGMIGPHSPETDQVLQTPTINPLQAFTYHQASIKTGEAETEMNTFVYAAEILINNNLPTKGDLSSRYLTTKRYGHRKVTGKLSMYFESEVERDKFLLGTPFNLIVTFTGPIIAGTTLPYYLQVILYQCQYTGGTSHVKPHTEPLVLDAPFQAFYEGVSPLAEKEIEAAIQDTVSNYNWSA